MAGLGAKDILRNVSALEQLIEEINFQRAKEMRQCLMSKDSDTGFVVVHGTTYWTDLFVRHFLFQTDRSTDADDLLFFIRKKHVRGSRYVPKYQTEVEVYRKDSRKLPIGDPDIDWEETVYLNLIIHQFDYTLTLAVCTRTSPKDLQILRRHSQKVYASPSRRRMDTKGEVEEITYPNVCFHVDNFDEVFCDMQVRDGEMVCVELVAADHSGARQAVIFLGSIRYDALKRVYDARASLSSKVAQRMMMGLFNSSGNQRIEFVRMKGPQGKGHAEMAVTKPKGSGVETPTSEPGVSLTDLWDSDWEDEPEDRLLYRHQRRLSDPSANFNTFINSGWRARGGGCEGGARSRSENEGLDSFADGLYEIESGDVRDASSSCKCCLVCGACIAPTQGKVHEDENGCPSNKCVKCQHLHTSSSFEDEKKGAATDLSSPVHDDEKPAEVIVVEPNTLQRVCDIPEDIERERRKAEALIEKRVSKDDESTAAERSQCDIHEEIKELTIVDSSAEQIVVERESSLEIISADECRAIEERVPSPKTEVDELTELEPLLCDQTNNTTGVPELEQHGGNLLSPGSEDDVFGDIINTSHYESIHRVKSLDSTSLVPQTIFVSPKSHKSEPVLSRSAILPRSLRKPGTAVRVPPSRIGKSSKRKKCLNGESTFYASLPVEPDVDETAFTVPEEESKRVVKDDPSISADDALTLSPLLKKKIEKKRRKVTIPYKITPDGTKVNFLSDIKLDDGAYNPLWSTRGFTQTFHFWKENRRAQSVPYNAYLTYVTLPWFTIITDILDHETGPILTF